MHGSRRLQLLRSVLGVVRRIGRKSRSRQWRSPACRKNKRIAEPWRVGCQPGSTIPHMRIRLLALLFLAALTACTERQEADQLGAARKRLHSAQCGAGTAVAGAAGVWAD